jgi:hypothetical protein
MRTELLQSATGNPKGQLTGTGVWTELDDEDADLVLRGLMYNIDSNGYPTVKISQRGRQHLQFGTDRLARIILERKLGRPVRPNYEADHIDGDTLNNRRENLREVTHAQNAMNSAKQQRGKVPTSQYKGVSRRHNKWQACIYLNKRKLSLGTYETEEEAHEAYRRAAAEYFGEHAKP